MKLLKTFSIALVALTISLNGFALDNGTKLQDLVTIKDIATYLTDQYTRHQSDVTKLNSARKGEITEINDELLSRLDWQELMAFIRNESTNEANRIVENFFGWDENYIYRLNSMQQAYDTFHYISITYPALVKKFKKEEFGFTERAKEVSWGNANPINPQRAILRKNNDLLFRNFNSLNQGNNAQSYAEIEQDRSIIGLIGLVTSRKIAQMGDHVSIHSPAKNDWEQMLVQSVPGELIKIPNAVATEKRKREKAKAEDDAKNARALWTLKGGTIEISLRLGDQETLEAAQALSALTSTEVVVTDVLASPWIKPVLNRRDVLAADIALLLSARRGENAEVSANILNNYGWDITISLFQNHQNHGLIDKVIQQVFDWDESYVRRLDMMNRAFTIFDRGSYLKGEESLYSEFAELDDIRGDSPYDGQGLDQLAIGLMGFVADKQYSKSPKNLDLRDWRKMIMERFYPTLSPLM